MNSKPELGEEAAVVQMWHGDPEAFTLLYERYFPRVYDLAFRMLGDPNLALDVAQETFLRLLEGRPRHPPRHFRAYLYTVARHQVYEALRRSRRQVPFSEIVPEEVIGPEASETPEQELLRQERTAILREALRALPEEEALLLDLYLRHGLSPAELARIFGRSVSAIHTRLSRARDHLEEALTAWILLRLGRRACPALARLVGAPGHPPPALTPDLRRALRQHLEGCATCQETRRQHWSAAEWLGAVGILPPPPEPARTVRERLSQRVQALTGGAVALGAAGGPSLPGLLQGLGILLLIGTLGLGLGVLVLGLLLATAGSAEVRVENRNCPPLMSPSVVVGFVSLLPNVEVPAVIPPGGTAIVRLPPGTATLGRSEEGLRVEAYGWAWKIPIAGLTQAEWDGADLPEGPYPIRLLQGSQHVLRVSCR